ncbi:MAG: sugar phosphate isomerase/epimerase family protein [Spirochaetota bacterium]
MDIGVHVSLWTPEWTSPFLDAIDLAADLGCTCVEIPLMDPFDFPVEEVRNRLAKNKLKVYCGTGLGTETDIGNVSDAVRERGMRHLVECLRICTDLGSSSLGGVLHSPWGMRGRVDSDYSARAAASLAALADRAEGLGVSIALECINRYENSFVNTVSQGLSLLGAIGKGNVGLHLDTYHMNIEERNMASAIAEAGSRILRMHLSENHRGFPGSGTLPWKQIIAAAKNAGYRGPWIVESYVCPDFAASADVCVWRPIEPDISKGLRDSLRFLKDLVGESL